MERRKRKFVACSVKNLHGFFVKSTCRGWFYPYSSPSRDFGPYGVVTKTRKKNQAPSSNFLRLRSRGGGKTPHMKGVGMLVVSLRRVNFGFWSHLGCSGQNAIIFSREGLVYGCTWKNTKILYCLCFNMVSFRGQIKLGPRPDRSPLGV